MSISLFQYILHLADNTLIMGQRNSEWTGHGPVLEQDIAITNISLDLLGQARNFYQYAASIYNNFNTTDKRDADPLLPRLWKTYNRELNEDDLAFLRDENQYNNLLITELPKGDWAVTILKQFFFSSFQELQYKQLHGSGNEQLAGIAEKSIKEVTYHVRWSSEWVVRLGDGTEESNKRMKSAIDYLWPFTGELFLAAPYEQQAINEYPGIDVTRIKADWLEKISAVLKEATLIVPQNTWMQHGGKTGKHTEHLGYLLAEMQYLQKTYPNVTW